MSNQGFSTLRYVCILVVLTAQFMALTHHVDKISKNQARILCLAYNDVPAVHADCVRFGWAPEREDAR